MTNALSLAQDYIRRARFRMVAVRALLEAGDFPDAVREAQESVELAIKALLKLKGITYPRAHDVARLLRDPSIVGPLLAEPEIVELERMSKDLRRDRELSFYGDEDVVPLDYYQRADGDAALLALERTVELVEAAFARNGSPVR